VVQALLGTLFTWGITALGAALVFLLPDNIARKNEKLILNASLGFASGVMIAASFWSLLVPAIEMSDHLGSFAFLPSASGIFLGGAFIHISEIWLPKTDPAVLLASQNEKLKNDQTNDEKSRVKENSNSYNAETAAIALKLRWKRIMLLVFAITVHNFPEGAAVGVGFGAIGKSKGATFQKARNLAIGIGIQNFPEGLAVSLPLRRLGYGKLKCFWYGQLSGIVEPIGGFLGSWLVQIVEPALPYFLAFAAGAMIFVVIDDLIPEARSGSENASFCANPSIWCIIGFIVMMSLDVGLG